MKLEILNLKAENKGNIELPEQFNEDFRPGLIKRAAIAIKSKLTQAYGAKPTAGLRHSAEISRRRHNYRGSYGTGISRVPRKVVSRRGTRFNWIGAVAPGTVGGRRAHPPKAEKNLVKNINDKERKKAIRCALTASFIKEVVSKKHQIPESYPFIISNEIESIEKTSELSKALKELGFEKEIARVKEKTIRAGKGKLRGRKYKTKVGPLIIVSKECNLEKVNNLPGVEIVKVNELNSLLLAPGFEAGRLIIISEDAVKKIKEDKLFV